MAGDLIPEDLLRDDPETRRAFREGEREAMEAVYTTYAPLVRTICGRGFGGFRGFFLPSDQDDAVQSVFAAAFEERTRLAYDGLQPYAAFLRGIAQNVCRRMLESRARFDRRPDVLPEPPEDVEASYLAAETSAVLRRFRDDLEDPVLREVLDRYFTDGWSEERLAAHLGRTRYRTRKLIALLQKRMTKLLAHHGLSR